MSRIPTVAFASLPPALRDKLELVRAGMGFVPNSLGAMGNRPDILEAFLTFGMVVMGTPDDPLHEIKALCAHVTSNASGCRYCQAHTASTAGRSGYGDKIAHAFEYETSDLFSEAEKAALKVAAHAGMEPNAVEDGDIAALRRHYGDAGATEIMAMIALFGFLNRWNDSLATELEPEPLEVAPALLKNAGWEPGKHGGKS